MLCLRVGAASTWVGVATAAEYIPSYGAAAALASVCLALHIVMQVRATHVHPRKAQEHRTCASGARACTGLRDGCVQAKQGRALAALHPVAPEQGQPTACLLLHPCTRSATYRTQTPLVLWSSGPLAALLLVPAPLWPLLGLRPLVCCEAVRRSPTVCSHQWVSGQPRAA